MTESNETTKSVDIQLWSDVQTKVGAEEKDTEGFMDELGQMEIDTQEDLEFAAQILAETKGKIKQLETMRKQATEPLRQTLEVIRGWFRPTISMLKKAEGILKSNIAAAHRRSEEKQQKALEHAAAASMSGDRETAADAMQQASSSELRGVGGLSFRETWDYEVTDLQQVPPEYLITSVNDTLVRSALQHHKGSTNIPGIRVFKKTGVSSRSA